MISREQTEITGALHFLKFAFLPAVKEDCQYCACDIYLENLVHFVKNSRTRQFNSMEAVVKLQEGTFIIGAFVTHCNLK